MAENQIHKSILSLQKNIDEGRYAKGLIVLASAHISNVAPLNDLINELDTPNIAFTIGVVNDSGEFEAIRSTPLNM